MCVCVRVCACVCVWERETCSISGYPWTSSARLRAEAGASKSSAPEYVVASNLAICVSVLRKRLVLDHFVSGRDTEQWRGGEGVEGGCNGSQRISFTVKQYRTVPYRSPFLYGARCCYNNDFFNGCAGLLVYIALRHELRPHLCVAFVKIVKRVTAGSVALSLDTILLLQSGRSG